MTSLYRGAEEAAENAEYPRALEQCSHIPYEIDMREGT